ncbi:MAG TPA: S1C family serine protease, partial [Accumulibacter sp.]|nr:S1C family serine protease [Accumulibacter sp.]
MPLRIFFLFGLICGWSLLAFSQTQTNKPIKPLSGTQIAARVNPSVCAVTIDCGNKDGMIGSGFCVGPNLVVTNKHVLGCNGTGQIHFEGKDPLPIKAVWVDPKQDLAILKIDLPKGIPLPLAVGVKQARGEDIFVFGNPRGLENTISKGIVSATRDEFVQFDAAISPGSSGGPVVDRFGHVIGVTTFYFKDGQNLNFAISADKVRDLLNQIRSGRLGETALNRIP